MAGGSLGAACDAHDGPAGPVVLERSDAQTEIEVGASVVAVVALGRVEGPERARGAPRGWHEMDGPTFTYCTYCNRETDMRIGWEAARKDIGRTAPCRGCRAAL